MRVFKFIKWWWNRADGLGRTVGCYLVLWVIPCLVLTIWLGKDAIALGVVGGFLVIAGWASYGIYLLIKDILEEFAADVPPEDIEIIRRLKGQHKSDGGY